VAYQDDESIGAANSGGALANILPAFRLDHAAKRLADIAAATIGLLLFSPLLLIAFIAIRLDSPGPVLVRERRFGCKNRPIQVLRFRLVDARPKSDRCRPRLTRIGRILSQTGVDELPRLVNVLRGEMSIIGPPPRAHPKMSLNRAKPGMIEWARITATREQPRDADRD
jgi:lipopolysaccharide/colanic/teichoic acid biosynthesis glycosyltransferase